MRIQWQHQTKRCNRHHIHLCMKYHVVICVAYHWKNGECTTWETTMRLVAQKWFFVLPSSNIIYFTHWIFIHLVARTSALDVNEFCIFGLHTSSSGTSPLLLHHRHNHIHIHHYGPYPWKMCTPSTLFDLETAAKLHRPGDTRCTDMITMMWRLYGCDICACTWPVKPSAIIISTLCATVFVVATFARSCSLFREPGSFRRIWFLYNLWRLFFVISSVER